MPAHRLVLTDRIESNRIEPNLTPSNRIVSIICIDHYVLACLLRPPPPPPPSFHENTRNKHNTGSSPSGGPRRTPGLPRRLPGRRSLKKFPRAKLRGPLRSKKIFGGKACVSVCWVCVRICVQYAFVHAPRLPSSLYIRSIYISPPVPPLYLKVSVSSFVCLRLCMLVCVSLTGRYLTSMMMY